MSRRDQDREASGTDRGRDIEGSPGDLAAQEHDVAAELRDREAEARDDAAGDRDRTAGRRAASDRQQAADERAGAASGRAEAAHNRAQGISDRKLAADDREQSAQDHDRAAELREREAGLLDDAAVESDREMELRAAGDRQDAAADRVGAAWARVEAADDRAQAAKDREYSRTDKSRGVRHRGERDAAAQERDVAAELRDREAEARDDAAGDRDRTAGRRAASDRQQAADERAGAASGRAEAAHTRAQGISDRKVAADDREQSAQDHDRAADLREREADLLDEAAVESDRAIELRAASDRQDAAADRAGAASARAEAADDRAQGLRIRAILENIGDGIVTLDAQGKIESFNHSAQRLLNYRPDEVIGQNINILVDQGRKGEFVEYLGDRMQPGKKQLTLGTHETLGRRKGGTTFPMEFVASDLHLGGRRLFIAILRDISERKAQTEALEHQALHDALTGMPNRTLFRDRLDQEIRLAARTKRMCGLILLDMDRFKEVNDALGHDAGDQLLAAFAVRMREALREADTVARLGGDEFAVLPGDVSEINALENTAQRITAALRKPFVVDGTAIQVRASMGIAVFPDHGDDVGTLMRRADIAMYVAKQSRSGYTVYAAQQEENMNRRLQLLGELRAAITSHQFVLHYQPRVDLATRQTVGVEALVRWDHPKFGHVPPSEFIAVAEESDLISPLTHWVLGEAIRQLRAWDQQGITMQCSVNLSAMNLLEKDLPITLQRMLKKGKMDASRLTLEITESTVISTESDVTLRALRAMGCGLSLDDFGTGYASLAYLRRLPLTELKLDQSFITVMAANEADAAIVRPAISLAHDLGLRVTAQGVEDDQSLQMLVDFGCDHAQGYLVAKPMPAADLPDWLEKGGWRQ